MKVDELKKLFRRHLSSIIVIAIILFIFIVWFGSSILEVIRLTQLKEQIKSEIAQHQEESVELDEGATRLLVKS